MWQKCTKFTHREIGNWGGEWIACIVVDLGVHIFEIGLVEIVHFHKTSSKFIFFIRLNESFFKKDHSPNKFSISFVISSTKVLEFVLIYIYIYIS
jgi:hypothetical protein